MQNPTSHTCAIIVTFNPILENVKKLCLQLLKQNCDVIIVDNSAYEIDLKEVPSVQYVWLKENKGIAYAQNVGIRTAKDQSYKYLIFFDQDSHIPNDFIFTLLEPMLSKGYKICAPVFYDEQRGFEYAITNIHKTGAREKLYSAGKEHHYQSSVVISSGTIVDVEIFNKVGLMDEGLFIDYVDTEWCLRCFSQNILINIIPTAKMLHSIGDKSFSLFGFTVPVHSASRRYYRVRNSFHLLRYTHVPKKMAIREIAFSFAHSIILSLTQPHKLKYLKSLLWGMIDGIMNVKGDNKHRI